MSASRTSRIRAAAVAGIPIAAILVATMGTGARADVDSVRATGYGARVSLLGGNTLAPTPDPTVSPPLLIEDETGPATLDPPSASAVNVGVPGLLTIAVLSSDSVAQGVPGDNHLGFVSNETRVAGVALGSVAPLVPGLAIDAVNTVCRSDGDGSVGSTEIIGGFAGPTPLIQSPTANTQIDLLGLAKLTLNEQIEVNTPPSGGNPGFTSIIVRGVVLRVPSSDGSVATVILAESQCSATGPDVLAPATTTTSTTSTTVAPTTTTSTTVPGATTTTSTSTTVPGATTTTSTSTTVPGATTTTSTTIVQGCNAATNSGGAGTTVTAHELGKPGPLSFQFTYNTQSVPDEMVIRYEGNVVFTTNGPVSTNGDVTTTVNLPAGTSTKVEVTVIGPSGTVWDYTVNCPGPAQTTTTSPTTTVVGPTTTTSTTVPVATTTTSTTLAPVVTVPGGTTLPVATTSTTRAPIVALPLARTGSNLLPLVGLGMLAIALGAVVRRSDQGLTPITDTATQPVAPPLPPEFRPVDAPPSAERHRTGTDPLDPATSDALSAFEADDRHDEPEPGGGG